MNRNVLLSLLAALVLFIVLYLGCDRTSIEEQKQARSVALTSKPKALDWRAEAAVALAALPVADQKALQEAEAVYNATPDGEARLVAEEKLSGAWYKANRSDISGKIALDIANQRNTSEAWSVAGATLLEAARTAATPELAKPLSISSYESFEKSSKLEPAVWQHQLNAALVLAEFPLQENPMKGVLSMLALDKEHPDHAGLQFHLGRFGIKTGQFEKATARLEKAAKLDPKLPGVYCLLEEAYTGLGDKVKAADAHKKCDAAMQK
jgi:tetratricopeptide (TPR) repeat protein